jgi:hypothetical protein
MGRTDKGSWGFALKDAAVIAVAPITDTDNTIEVCISSLPAGKNERIIFNVSAEEFNRMVDMLVEIKQAVMEVM